MHSSRSDTSYSTFKLIRFRSCMKILICAIVFSYVMFRVLCLLNDIHAIEDDDSAIEVQVNATLIRHLHHFDQNDSELVEMLKSNLIPPSDKDYQLLNPLPAMEHVLEREVRQINNLRRGFFVEVGAGDGETRSPTLCLESEDGWSGLLVEADPHLAEPLLKKRRKSIVDMSCVGIGQHSYVGYLSGSRVMPQEWTRAPTGEVQQDQVEVQCSPLYTHLEAAGIRVVDFLVLNMNGGELEVLRSLPWNQIEIKIIAVRLYKENEILPTNNFMNGKDYIFKNVFNHMDESFILYCKRNILNSNTNTSINTLPMHHYYDITRLINTSSISRT